MIFCVPDIAPPGEPADGRSRRHSVGPGVVTGSRGPWPVADGATGDFRAHYVRSARDLAATMQRQRSTLTGHVVSSGVVDVVPDRATVIVATSGTVANRRTGGQEVPRHYRLRLTLLREGDRWLTSDIAFVGDAA